MRLEYGNYELAAGLLRSGMLGPGAGDEATSEMHDDATREGVTRRSSSCCLRAVISSCSWLMLWRWMTDSSRAAPTWEESHRAWSGKSQPYLLPIVGLYETTREGERPSWHIQVSNFARGFFTVSELDWWRNSPLGDAAKDLKASLYEE
jgi:hypothetical protein